MLAIKISLYLGAFVLANFIVLWMGPPGLIITALFLIPFDFVMRCIFHEQWKGWDLIFKLGALVLVAGLITAAINFEAVNIAQGSVCGYVTAQIVAGLFYQRFINKTYFIKVNGSDLIAILVDSVIFQLVAFDSIDLMITISQTGMKAAGGLFWYWVLFVKLKLHKKW